MELESLTCEKCSKTWKREKARGRKPKLCTKCTLIPVDQPKVKASSVKKDTLYPKNTNWHCPSCNVHIEVGVKIYTAPIHKCQKRANRVIPLELILN
jgi:hypothetical protein